MASRGVLAPGPQLCLLLVCSSLFPAQCCSAKRSTPLPHRSPHLQRACRLRAAGGSGAQHSWDGAATARLICDWPGWPCGCGWVSRPDGRLISLAPVVPIRIEFKLMSASTWQLPAPPAPPQPLAGSLPPSAAQPCWLQHRPAAWHAQRSSHVLGRWRCCPAALAAAGRCAHMPAKRPPPGAVHGAAFEVCQAAAAVQLVLCCPLVSGARPTRCDSAARGSAPAGAAGVQAAAAVVAAEAPAVPGGVAGAQACDHAAGQLQRQHQGEAGHAPPKVHYLQVQGADWACLK